MPRSLTCSFCGSTFTADSTTEGTDATCPHCAAAEATPPVIQPLNVVPPVIGPPPRRSKRTAENYLAKFGLILSMFGILTCGLTAPFGMYLSFQGLRQKRDRSIALTGLIIGGIQTLALFCFLAFFAAMAGLMGVGAAFATLTGTGREAPTELNNKADDVQQTHDTFQETADGS